MTEIATNARDFERDLVEFTGFALDYVENWKKNWWGLDKQSREKCKQILFPAGFYITLDKKVYTPEISLVYSYGSGGKPDFLAESVRLEVQPKNNLHFLVDEMVRWRGIIGQDYSRSKQIKQSSYS